MPKRDRESAVQLRQTYVTDNILNPVISTLQECLQVDSKLLRTVLSERPQKEKSFYEEPFVPPDAFTRAQLISHALVLLQDAFRVPNNDDLILLFDEATSSDSESCTSSSSSTSSEEDEEECDESSSESSSD